MKKPDTEDDSVSVKKRRVGSNTVYGEEPQFEVFIIVLPALVN